MKFATALLAFVFLFSSSALAQDDVQVAPKHEFRSAWIATAVGLDFPRGSTASQQEANLRSMIRNMKTMGMNAVVFQISPRGDAYYQSDRLPWARRLSGTMGADPGWDPLAVAIEESHRLGMELHAWYNVGKIGDIGSADLQDSGEPRHLYFTDPELIVEIGSEVWLNPGIPEAREWAVANVMEIVRNYDVDAVHFDFIRYGASSYPGDSQLRDEHDPGMNISAWRRENITRFATAAYDSIKAEKWWVKVGSAPLGHYKESGGWGANLAYYQVYQDSRRWLDEGKHDYLAPQIYWGIGSSSDAPQFEWLVDDWMGETYGRHIYVGTAPYKPNVLSELPAQIDTTRAHGAHGQVHFRYDFISSAPFGGRYATEAVVPPMQWLNMVAPPAPEAVAYQWSETDTTLLEISWDAPEVDEAAVPARFFAVYRVESEVEPDFEEVVQNPANLFSVTGETFVTDRPLADATFHYYVTSLSPNNVESSAEASVVVEGRVVSNERETPVAFELRQNYPNPFNPTTAIEFAVERPGEVSLRVFNVLGQEVAVLVNGTIPAGSHTAQFDADGLSSGTYFYVLEAGGRTATRAMMLLK
ncbi:MAG: family 10 glycosylhydrolase [Bacteroidota bacterium]